MKAEIHGSAEATTAQEQSDSDSGAEATRRDHHYEDIYMPREEHQRRRSVYLYNIEVPGQNKRWSLTGEKLV